MLARTVSRIARSTPIVFRAMGTATPNASNHHGNWSHHAEPAPSSVPKDVVIPELVDSLEWVLDCPPSVHQFEEPPIVVEVEHLKNLKIPENP